jgi:hypothetical protein
VLVFNYKTPFSVGSTLVLAHPLYYKRLVQLASIIFGTIRGANRPVCPWKRKAGVVFEHVDDENWKKRDTIGAEDGDNSPITGKHLCGNEDIVSGSGMAVAAEQPRRPQ